MCYKKKINCVNVTRPLDDEDRLLCADAFFFSFTFLFSFFFSFAFFFFFSFLNHIASLHVRTPLHPSFYMSTPIQQTMDTHLALLDVYLFIPSFTNFLTTVTPLLLDCFLPYLPPLCLRSIPNYICNGLLLSSWVFDLLLGCLLIKGT